MIVSIAIGIVLAYLVLCLLGIIFELIVDWLS
jgi:hypothetical protein